MKLLIAITLALLPSALFAQTAYNTLDLAQSLSLSAASDSSDPALMRQNAGQPFQTGTASRTQPVFGSQPPAPEDNNSAGSPGRDNHHKPGNNGHGHNGQGNHHGGHDNENHHGYGGHHHGHPNHPGHKPPPPQYPAENNLTYGDDGGKGVLLGCLVLLLLLALVLL